MPDVSHLLSTPMDDPSLNVPLCPVGTWKGELVAIKVSDTRQDKNGDDFFFVRLLCRPHEPEADVDRKDAKQYLEAGGPDEGILSFSKFMRRKRDVRDLNNLFERLGVPHRGRSLQDVASGFSGGIPILFEVSHRTDDEGTTREDVEVVYPAS